jgi:hypothetical protein
MTKEEFEVIGSFIDSYLTNNYIIIEDDGSDSGYGIVFYKILAHKSNSDDVAKISIMYEEKINYLSIQLKYAPNYKNSYQHDFMFGNFLDFELEIDKDLGEMFNKLINIILKYIYASGKITENELVKNN